MLGRRGFHPRNETEDSKAAFLIGKHRVASGSPTGRGPKGFITFLLDAGHEGLYFLKDSWRADSKHIHPELEVYQRLKASGVTQGVATAVAGGDVGGPNAQCTETRNETNKNVPGGGSGTPTHPLPPRGQRDWQASTKLQEFTRYDPGCR